MIILVTFIICVLIFIVTYKSNKVYTSTNPNYKEIIFWKDDQKAYSLLLHSITTTNKSFSAYSTKRDSLIVFNALPAEIESIRKKMKFFPNTQNCYNCHEK